MSELQRPFKVSQTEYPFKSHWLERNGARMHYVDEGAGLPVLMLHGNPTWSFLYRKVILQLNGNFRTIAPDLPGFGFSDHPIDYGYSPQEHATWIEALIDELALDEFILVIQDWGGPIGMSIAVDHPDKIAGLLIANTWSWKPDYSIWRIFSIFFDSPLGKFLIFRQNVLAGLMLPSMFTRPEVKTTEVLNAYRAPFPTPASRVGIHAFVKALGHSDDWLEAIERKLHHLSNKPVELLIGLQDAFFAKDEIITRWQHHFPNANLERIPEAGHFMQEEYPGQMVAAIQRIQSNLGN